MARNSAISNYRQTSASEAAYATPHRLVQMLMVGVLQGVSAAKGAVQQGLLDERHKQVKWVISLLDALRGALDFEAGGEIAHNLDALYDYMIRRLYEADTSNQTEPLDEVTSLMSEIKEAWDAMPELIQRAENIREALATP
jgi:flagellar protein FliS